VAEAGWLGKATVIVRRWQQLSGKAATLEATDVVSIKSIEY